LLLQKWQVVNVYPVLLQIFEHVQSGKKINLLAETFSLFFL
jgi:hypothetical protein